MSISGLFSSAGSSQRTVYISVQIHDDFLYQLVKRYLYF